MVDYNKNLLEKESMRIKNAESDIEYYQSEINKFKEPYTDSDLEFVEPLRLKLNGSRRQLTISRKSHQEISRTYNYLRTSVETLKNTHQEITCPICLDEIETDSLTITKCGHKFCWDCIYETHQVQKQINVAKIKCPTCNTSMDNTELYLLSKQTILSNQSDLQTIIQNVKSTKIGNIIYFLKTSINKNDKVILFSQWDELLHKVGGILSEQGLKIMYCNGSVYQRKKAIDYFCKDPDINLILLSSRNAASGINLTVANKIILLEPIYGNKEYRENIEEQAIGRADRLGQKRPIYIYRFIIKNTIEEDIYTNCIDDSKIRQLH
jgi:SNF2 family DNA or RNA helicase